jgi:peptidyl-prolyl cis-trans isomerase A (cyclophilin A)
MRAPIFVFTAMLMLAAASAFAQDSQQSPSTTPPPANAAAAAPAALENPAMTGPRLLIATSMGDITLQLDAVRAPKSVANVLRYVRNGHYNGTAFYRVVKGFVIQMGSFDAQGKGRGVFPGPVPLEADNGLHNLRGTVALAHGDDPNSATADFFINLDDNRPLDRNDAAGKIGFAVFAEVADGMDVVDQIAQVPVGDNGPMAGAAPVDPILIKKVTLLK